MTTSWAPTDTPPLATTTSAQPMRACESRDDIVERRRARCPADATSAPARPRLSATRPTELLSGICAGPSGSPGGDELVAGGQDRRRAARRWTLSVPWPPAAAAASVAGASAVPRPSSGSPARRSLPARRMCAPGGTRRGDRDDVGGSVGDAQRRVGVLDRHDRVGAGRHRRAGQDAHRRARLDARRRRRARGRPRRSRAAATGASRGCAGDVRRAHREAVHRAVVPRRQRQPARRVDSASTRPSASSSATSRRGVARAPSSICARASSSDSSGCVRLAWRWPGGHAGLQRAPRGAAQEPHGRSPPSHRQHAQRGRAELPERVRVEPDQASSPENAQLPPGKEDPVEELEGDVERDERRRRRATTSADDERQRRRATRPPARRIVPCRDSAPHEQRGTTTASDQEAVEHDAHVAHVGCLVGA